MSLPDFLIQAHIQIFPQLRSELVCGEQPLSSIDIRCADRQEASTFSNRQLFSSYKKSFYEAFVPQLTELKR